MNAAAPVEVVVLGAGSWGTTVCRIAAQNVTSNDTFSETVKLWVFDETVSVDGKPDKLSHAINTRHENVKYLPGIQLPSNVVAVPDLEEAVREADVLLFVVPQPFLEGVVRRLKGKCKRTAHGVSFVKGLFQNDGKISLISEFVEQQLGISMSCVGGANVAMNIAREEFSEATIGYRKCEEATADMLHSLLNTSYFRCSRVCDVAGVELCGALKNVVALGAGFVDGLSLGPNTKAAVMRKGMEETRVFAKLFRPGVDDRTFWESAGVADIVASCYGGRNCKYAAEFVHSGKTWDQIHEEFLSGQKLQGVHSTHQVYSVIQHQGLQKQLPMITAIYRISFEGAPPQDLFRSFEEA